MPGHLPADRQRPDNDSSSVLVKREGLGFFRGREMDINSSAPKLSRNPLGIIALFLLLVYGVASLLFSFSGGTLTLSQRWWFVIFLVSFPVIVLVAFVYLVVCHHQNLYAPGDFREEEHFFGYNYQSPKEKEEQLKTEEKKEIKTLTKMESYHKSEPEKSRERVSKIRERIRKSRQAEDLAFNYYENKFDYDIDRDVYIKDGSRRLLFDGIARKSGRIYLFKVKYLKDNDIPESFFSEIEDIVSDAVRAKRILTAARQDIICKLKIVVVTETENLSEREEIRDKINSTIDTERISVFVRVLLFKQLEKYSQKTLSEDEI